MFNRQLFRQLLFGRNQMKTLFIILALIPVVCFAGENLIYDTGLNHETKAQVLSSDNQKTAVNFQLRGLQTEPVTLNGANYTRFIPLESELI